MKRLFGQLWKRLALLGLAGVSVRAGWFFMKIFIGITDRYDLSTPEGGHLDVFKAGVHLPALMGSCLVWMCFWWAAIFLIRAACIRWDTDEKKQDEKED